MSTLREKKKRQQRVLIVVAALLVMAVAALLIWQPFEKPAPPDMEPTASPAILETSVPAVSPDILETPVPAVSPAIQSTSALSPEQTGFSLYEAVIAVDTKEELLFGKLRLTYVNRYADSLFTVMMNLFPNAVSENCLTLTLVTVNGFDADYTLSADNTHLTIPLMRELKTGESTPIYIEYIIKIPKTNNRFGAGDDRFMFGNSIPIAAVYENGAWRTDAYYVKGDSFYSEVADYSVSISTTESYTIACTGSVEEERTEAGITTVLAKAHGVRDFAFSLQKNAYVTTREVNGIEVVGISDSQRGATFAAGNGADALMFFSEKLCDYPYDRLCVVGFDTGGGMEYPGLVMIDAEILNGSANIQPYAAMTVAHEVAHQWFYGIVGSDPLKEPWVDESLVDFLGFEFIRETTQNTYTPLWDYVFQGLAGYKRTLRLDAPLSSFPDSTSDYFFVIYAYGSHVMRELYETIGEDAFYDALQIYIGEHGYKNAKGSDLIAAFSDAAGKDLSGWFEKRIAVH
jgi:hypothetical protein